MEDPSIHLLPPFLRTTFFLPFNISTGAHSSSLMSDRTLCNAGNVLMRIPGAFGCPKSLYPGFADILCLPRISLSSHHSQRTGSQDSHPAPPAKPAVSCHNTAVITWALLTHLYFIILNRSMKKGPTFSPLYSTCGTVASQACHTYILWLGYCLHSWSLTWMAAGKG